MMKHTMRFRRSSAALVAASLFLGACGSDSTNVATPGEEATTTQTTAADAPTTSTAAATDGTPLSSSAASGTDAIPSSGFLGSYTLDDVEFGTQVTVTVEGDTRSVEANALPDHETGEFPNSGNPNTISAQDLSYEYPLVPTYTGDQTPVRTPGVAVNGVKFEPATAETVTCGSGETLRVEALQDIYDLGLDFNNAHVQPTGEYHYHGASELLADAYSTGDDLVHVGFAADGYLMYYSLSGAYDSGYALTEESRSGTNCVGSGALQNVSVEIDGTTPDGTYTSDWMWTEAAGDLDECNGIDIDGTYAYIVTDTYPFVGRCLNGEASADAAPGGPPPDGEPPAGGAAPQDRGAADTASPAGAPDLTEAAAALGVSLEALQSALGGPPPDFNAAAETLGLSVADLIAALPGPSSE